MSVPASHISTGYVSQQLVSLDQFFECVCVCVCVCVCDCVCMCVRGL